MRIYEDKTGIIKTEERCRNIKKLIYTICT